MFTSFILSYIIHFVVLWPWFPYHVIILVIHMNCFYDMHNNVIDSFP